ncbi:Dabb family protein [Chromobacterium sp. IIBBL 290-4]|uniref:Dabb family protein n=1 Tax=Chromobacterium sp. IIBBL 290-4 TaxID=2953890 RepID=UPI0020B7F266|nr:Dabb family protein [Chromobacterium sp. IIBBL 290-4]UTH75627.1 Dabb family protein [Chromobacterium sp. IIBBL 290-4]
MLMHIVLFTFKKPWSWESEEAIDAEKATHAHPDHIAEIKGWTCGRNTTKRDIAADFVVVGLFENREELNAYIIHPNHQLGVMKWKAIADWKVVDVEVSSETTLNSGLLSVLNNLVGAY